MQEQKELPLYQFSGRGQNDVTIGPKDRVFSRKNGQIKLFTSSHELGFGITFHKVQGQTLSKVILCLEKPQRKDGKLSTASLYVGMTMVRKNSDMRIFPLSNGTSLNHLLNLKIDTKLPQWRNRYNSFGQWVHSSTLQ